MNTSESLYLRVCASRLAAHTRRSLQAADPGRVQHMRRLATVTAVALALTAATASAQSSPWQQEVRTTGGWVFTPGFAGGIAWDSGIDTASNPVVEKLFQSWVTTASPRAELDYNSRRTQLNLGYSGSIEKYLGSSTGYEQHARLSVSRTLSPRFTIRGEGSLTASPTTDRLFMTDAVVPYAEIDSTWLSASGALAWRASERTSVDAEVRVSRVTLDQDQSLAYLEFLRAGDSIAPSVRVLRAMSARLTLGSRGEFRRENIADTDTFDIGTVTGEFVYRASASTTINGGAGVSRLVVYGFETTKTAPTLHAGVEHRIGRAEFSGGYERAFRPMFGFGSLATSDAVSGEVTMPLRDRVYYLAGSVAYNRSTPVEELGIGFDQESLWATLAMGRRLAPWLSAEGYVTVTRQGSTLFDTFNRTRIGVQFVTSKPVRIQ